MEPRKFRAKESQPHRRWAASPIIVVRRRHAATKTIEYVQLFLQRRDHARQAIREFGHAREDQQDHESEDQRHAGHKQQRHERARNVQRFESPRRRTQHDADDESRHDWQHDLARGVENEADRDCGKDRQRPSRNFPQRDFGMGLLIRHRDRLGTLAFPHRSSASPRWRQRVHWRIARRSGHPVAFADPDSRSLENNCGSILNGGT